MRKGYAFFLIGFFLVGLASCKTSSGTTITFIHLNDLHAHLTPHADLAPDAPWGQTAPATKVVELGGLARIKTKIDEIRLQNPNSVLMNIGDTYHGGVEAMYTTGNAIIDPVDALGIDVGVPGNWDFAYGPTATRQRYTEDRTLVAGDILAPANAARSPNFPNLAANVTFTLPLRKRGETICPPTMLKDVGGVTVGFVGITSDIVPMMHQALAIGFDFLGYGEPPAVWEAAYRDLINQHARDLRAAGAQVVVVMSELGIQKDYRLANIIDAGLVDVFFSAHTHERTFEPLSSSSGALVVEAGNDGFLGQMDITVVNGQVTGHHWVLHPITSDIAEDATVKALVDTARAPFLAADVNMTDPNPSSNQTLTEPISSPIGWTEGPLDRRHALENHFNNAFTDLLRRKAGTQLAMTPGFRFDTVVAANGYILEDNTVADGQITIEDVYRFFPLAYTISTAEVTGQNLKTVMEDGLTHVFSPTIFEQAGGWFDGFSGLSATLNLANGDGSRVVSLQLKDTGEAIADDTVMTVTGCSRPGDDADVLCSHPGFTSVTPLVNPATGDPWTAIDLLIDGARELASGGLGLPSGERRDLQDLNGTVLWPAGTFVQPLEGVQ